MADVVRKGPTGRYTEAFKAQVVAWLGGEEGRGYQVTADHWGVSVESARKWAKAAGVAPTFSRETPNTAPSGSRATPTASQTPVADMGAEDKRKVVSTARNLATIVELGSQMLVDSIRAQKAAADNDPGWEGFGLDMKTSQALLNYARTVGVLCDTHPGLLKVAGIQEKRESGGRNLDRIAKALGLKGAK